MSTEVIHHLPSRVGVVIGKETTHGTKSTSMTEVIGRGVVFAESVAENKVEYYDPSCGQALQGVVPGAKDIDGGLNFQLINWKWLSWQMGSDTMDEIQMSSVVGVFAPADTIEGATSGFTATVASVSGTILTLTGITGTPVQGEAFDDGGAKTAVLQAFIHDIGLGEYPQSLSIEDIFEELAESEEYYGMMISEGTLTSTRGEIIPVDLTCVGLDEDTNSVDPSSRICSTETPWTWDKGSIILNGVTLDNVCDSVSLKTIRNLVARGGHNRIAHKVVPGNFKAEVTVEMDLPSSAARILRRDNTKVAMTLEYTNVADEQTALLTLTDLQIMSDVRDTSKDAETVRVSIVGVTGQLDGRIFDDIFAY